MIAHLDDATLRAFASGALDPAATLAADDHLAACAACRDRAANLLGTAAAASALSPAAEIVHLTDDEMQTAATGVLLSPDLRAHLARCETCQHEVTALRDWAAHAPAPPARRTPRAWLALAAGLLVAAALGWVAFGVPASGIAGLEQLDAPGRQRVEALLASSRVPLPAVLDELAQNREVLMGEAGRGSFSPLRPLGIVLSSDRPKLTWSPLAGARSYRVVIVDAALAPIAESPVVAGTEWAVQTPLPRGRTYTWQVTAETAGGPVTAPAPPAPAARFHVVDAATVAQIAAVEAGAPDAHLVLGLLYAEAGLLDDATFHLGRVDGSEPHAALARDTLAAIEARRRRS